MLLLYIITISIINIISSKVIILICNIYIIIIIYFC